ncbi:MAG: hypothetical protein WD850_00965 [Candidatus Spechtbacterales bacterium]
MNNDLQNNEFVNAITTSMEDLLRELAEFLPNLVAAIVVFVALWIIGVVLGKLVMRVLQTVGADRVFDEVGVTKYLRESGVDWTFSGILAGLVRWFFIIAGFLAAVDILNLDAVSSYLNDILIYIPSIIVAALILLVGAVLATFLERVLSSSLRATNVGPARLVGTVARWSVWTFAILAALSQLGIASDMINILTTGLVAMLAIAGGIAFGFGGQGVAKDILEGVRRDVTER